MKFKYDDAGFYVGIAEQGEFINVTDLEPPELTELETAFWNGVFWTKQPKNIALPTVVTVPEVRIPPKIVISNMTTDDPNSSIDGFVIAIPVGTTVTFDAVIQDSDGNIIPVTDSFRVPIESTDLRERFAFAKFVDGHAHVATTFRESGLWFVTESGINKRLPPNMWMTIDPIEICSY